ncbi:hypothetical protein [Conexibacter sp. SYSU D00693]|uniref:hypothetical protein n=1 Tax=Conexibacter sp. SYSU D00693 TaxID=2812560 RepID=UPI00196A2D1C|nr:hypothetical protein [Conexibacter sp. SYSU D00693]
MALADLLPRGVVFAPRPRGFGARLLGLDPEAVRTSSGDTIVAARQERDLLRPDLTVLAADGRLLPDALAPVADPEDWGALELPEAERVPAFGATLAAVAALAGEGPVGVVLTGPGRLAADLAAAGGGEVDEELVDVCALAVCDAAKAVVQAGGEVVLEDDRAPSPDALVLWSPLLKLLAHHRRPALVVLDDGAGAEVLRDVPGVSAVVHGAAAPAWGAPWPADHGQPAFSPRIDASASPERVQELVRATAGVA